MATTATINITSDITESIPFNVNAEMTMYQAGTTIDLEETTGLAQRTFSGNTTQVILLDVSAESVTASGANKVYIRNTGTDKTQHFKVTLADTTDDTEEIMVQPSSSDKMTIEYAVFHQ